MQVNSPGRRGPARVGDAPGLAIAAGALVVAVAAQVTVPVPLSPVPMTLQPLAVLAVGGVLGARAGAAVLVLYLMMGLIGLPVFAAGSAGIGRLLGPTGGYLLAFPVAAALTGLVAGRAPGVLGALWLRRRQVAIPSVNRAARAAGR
jgi:biotin transport system substrate-specific component